jgi:plastocyanin
MRISGAFVTLALTAGGGLLASGCGAATAAAPQRAAATSAVANGAARAKPALQRVTIVGNDSFRFVPSVVHLHVGRARITLKDSGAYPHNIVIPALGVTSASVTGDPGGTEVVFTVNFNHKGRYAFFCEYHRSAGMVGTFVVS